MVLGVTRNDDHRSRSTNPASSAISARSNQVKPGTNDLTTKNGELVAQQQDLGLLCQPVHPADTGEFEGAAEAAVDEGEDHKRDNRRKPRAWSSGGHKYLDPSSAGYQTRAVPSTSVRAAVGGSGSASTIARSPMAPTRPRTRRFGPKPVGGSRTCCPLMTQS